MITIVTGPPCSGKTTYMNEHAKTGDIKIDADAIAMSIGFESHAWDAAIVLPMRRAGIDALLKRDDVDAWIIDTEPSDASMQAYEEAGAHIVHCDADYDACVERAETDARPKMTFDAIDAYFGEKDATMLKKSFTINDIQDDGGEIIAYAATFDRVPDSYGDVIAPGAFAKTLADWQASGNSIPLLFGHRTDDPMMNIGSVVEASEDEQGLRIRAKFDPDNPNAQYARKLVKEGRLSKLSFAYDVKDASPIMLDDGTRANELRELKLYEVSLVPIPANDLTSVIEVKDASSETFGMTNEEWRALRNGDITMDDITKKTDAQHDADSKAGGDELGTALSAIRNLTERLDEIAEAIDDMAKRIAVLTDTDAVDDSADEAKACGDEEARRGNSKAADASAVLEKMAQYIQV